MSFPQPRPRLDALGAQLRAMQMVKHIPAPSGSVIVSAVRKDAGQATQFVTENHIYERRRTGYPEPPPHRGTHQ